MPTSDPSRCPGDRVDPTHLRCPEQHSDLVDTSGPTVYCKGCGHAYRYANYIDTQPASNRPLSPRSADN